MERRMVILCIWFMASVLVAQQPRQNIKGKVVDVDSHKALPGVNVYLMDTNPPIGTITDKDGFFRIEDVPVGRYSIQFSFMGYEAALINEMVVGAGKEIELSIFLKENYQQLEEIVITPAFRKDKAQNDMAALSARSFSVDEAMRYAGGWNDPSRLAGSFAGVTMAEGVNDNAIVIRGNAPKGILWRLEGVEIPAPNHLNGVNNGGGIETVFSVNMLDNSDFFTGAFPAEYGNAMSGVFDMRFRNGNSNKRESSFQIGTQGIDLGSEGPLVREGEASYLFNYRYSTLGLVGKLVGEGFGMPSYQDLSLKIYLPTSNAGVFSVWGIGGSSEVAFEPDENPHAWKTTFDNNKYTTESGIGAIGISHQINVNKKSYLNTSVAGTFSSFGMLSNQLQRDFSEIPIADHKEDNKRIAVNSFINTKLSHKHSNKTGVKYSLMNYHLNIMGNTEPGITNELISIADQTGFASQWQFFSQSKWRLTSVFDICAGFNLSYLDMNREWVAEPRMSLSWRFLPRHSLHLAYGVHSRLESLRFYQATNSHGVLLNPDLKISKARHYVLSYDYRIHDNMKLKLESYYQYLFDIPVVNGSSISLINYTWDIYFEEALENKGSGYNVGLDVTLERYMTKGYYYMFTGSLFNSRYIGGDQVERNTSFNRNFVVNFLMGKEWGVRRSNVIGVNSKIAFMGGNRFTPADAEASAVNEIVVLDDSKAYEWQEDPKLFVDLAVNYKINKEKRAHILSFQMKNVLMQKEMFGWAYDFNKNEVVEHGLTMVYPYFSYKIEF